MKFPSWSMVACALAALAGCAHVRTVPARRAADVVRLEVTPSNEYVAAGARGELVARIRVAVPPGAAAQRPPVNLALVVDTSGSMEGRAIEDARAACRALVDALSDGDRLAVVVFHSTGEVLVPSTRIDRATRADVRRRLDAMTARGTTDMTAGLRLGLDELNRNYTPEGLNRVVLLSDGVPNDASRIPALAAEARSRGVPITALGLGLDFDETLMAQVAQQTGGRFHFVDASAQVAAMFRDEVLRIRHIAARGASLAITAGPGVEILGVVGQQSPPGARAQVHLGDVVEGEPREVFVRLRAPSRRDGASVELLDAVVTLQDPATNAYAEQRAFLGVHATRDDALLTRGRHPEVEEAAERVRLAAVQVQAVEMARNGQVAQAQQHLDANVLDAAGGNGGAGGARAVDESHPVMRLRRALPALAPRRQQPAHPAANAREPNAAEAPEPASDEQIARDQRAVRRLHDDAVNAVQGY